jgi:hypothetical protein
MKLYRYSTFLQEISSIDDIVTHITDVNFKTLTLLTTNRLRNILDIERLTTSTFKKEMDKLFKYNKISSSIRQTEFWIIRGWTKEESIKKS